MGNFQEVFPIILSLFSNLKLMSVFIHETFLVYKLETFKNCRAGKPHDYDYDFLSYVIFGQQLKITFRKSSGPSSKKSTPS